MFTSLSVLIVLCFLSNWGGTSLLKEQKTKWDYVTVRPHAHMFWWLYYTTAAGSYTYKPLILWLQGGPGGSSTGFGNFQEIGPLNVKLEKRSTSWVSVANVLFVDNPVGTGFSYTTDDSAFATDVKTISDDLVTVMKSFLKGNPTFQTVPFYVFSESYGGKMAAAFSQGLYGAIQSKAVRCNFKGFAMGDSWISPEASTLSWAPYLFATSVVDENGKQAIDKAARQASADIQSGRWKEATQQWSVTEEVLENSTNDVNFYNILRWGTQGENLKFRYKPSTFTGYCLEKSYLRHIMYMQPDELSTLMNGPVRKMLGVIPDNVTWGGQSEKVFQYQRTEFMKPVVNTVDELLKTTNLSVVVYSGQLDLIVNTLGTEAWVQTLKWPGLVGYNKSTRKPIYINQKTAAFVKTYKNFSFYWILAAGHMVPSDAGYTALEMVKMVTQH